MTDTDHATIVIIGGGLCGLLTGMLLADDGHRVTVLERDPAPPTDPLDAWDGWERASVRQFHMGHYFLPRFRAELAQHLPRVLDGLRAGGALSVNPIVQIPAEVTGGARDGDDRFEAVTGRRPMVEAVVAACAAATPGLTVRRGVTVAALTVADRGRSGDGGHDGHDGSDGGGPPHVVGVETTTGERLAARLVVDASGRSSVLPRLLTAIGAEAPVDESEDSGFVYYGRAYRSADGSLPPTLGGGLQAYGSISTLTLPADNGTWQLAVVASGRDRTLRRARHQDRFDALWRSYPLVAHWLDGQPISDIEVMANLEDRIRHFSVGGRPVATGIVAVGDAWACTNPSVGRGASLGLLHGITLRRHLRAHPLGGRPVAWTGAWQRATADAVEPYYRETVRGDRHRLAQIEAAIEQRPYRSDDPHWQLAEAMSGAAGRDPDALRAFLDTFMLHRLMADVLADEELTGRILRLGASPEAAPGLTRPEVEDLLVA